MSEIDNSIESIYNAKSLYLLNIKELRSIGRQLGVSAPASKNKEELVSSILKVVYGEVETSFRIKSGRPSKNDYDLESCLDKLRKNADSSNKLKNFTYEPTSFDYGMKLVSSKQENYNINSNIETRFFCKEDGGFYLKIKGFVKSDDDIEISDEFVKKFNLEDMDIVEIIKGKQGFNLYSVNGIKVKDDSPVPIDEENIFWGRNQDFYLSTKEEIIKKINKVISFSDDKNIKVLVFGKGDFQGKNCVLFKYDENESHSIIYKKLMGFMESCERLSLAGENLIAIFENALFVESKLEMFDSDILSRIKNYLSEKQTSLIEIGNSIVKFKLQEDIEY